MAYCLAREGILPIPTEDAHGAQRFHIFDDVKTLILDYGNFTQPGARSPSWVADYHEPFMPLLGGLPGVSAESVLFHYTTGLRRVRMHDLLYRRACDRAGPRAEEL